MGIQKKIIHTGMEDLRSHQLFQNPENQMKKINSSQNEGQMFLRGAGSQINPIFHGEVVVSPHAIICFPIRNLT